MEHKSIAQVKELFETSEITEEMLNTLSSDKRKGVQQLVRTYLKKQRARQEAEKMFVSMTRYEQSGYAQNYELIAGVDEAGRGPLAGPVVAAAVILPSDFKLIGLTDSKLLKHSERVTFYKQIKQRAISYGISLVSNEKIDELNILQATKHAMYHALKQLHPQPDYVLLDAIQLEKLQYPSKSIIKGDQKSISIAAASILAKVTRDQLMNKIGKEYPQYQFSSNMGYGTKQHIDMLKKHGATPYHRRSFAPVRDAVSRSLGGD
ncbi:ribonuclease HII [Virgibacillus sp. W0181]|uniref:ribonuclease HII n=1 Tax=Virgibacillus sp. W0181 TaxID=3391581 RepID=UPI003F487005